MSEASRYCTCGHLYGQHYGHGLKSPCHSLGCNCRDWTPKQTVSPASANQAEGGGVQMLPIEEVKRESKPLSNEELWGDPQHAQCVCGKPITHKMVTFDYVPCRQMWVHDHSNSVECDRRVAQPAVADIPSSADRAEGRQG